MAAASIPLGLSMTPAGGGLFLAERNEPGFLRIRVWPAEVDECSTWSARDAGQIEQLRMITQHTCED